MRGRASFGCGRGLAQAGQRRRLGEVVPPTAGYEAAKRSLRAFSTGMVAGKGFYREVRYSSSSPS